MTEDRFLAAAKAHREAKSSRSAKAPRPKRSPPASNVYEHVGPEPFMQDQSPAESWDAANECLHGLLRCTICNPSLPPASYPGVREVARAERALHAAGGFSSGSSTPTT